jgi:hypothetical protein
MTPYPWPWEECGEVFYGWADPSWVSHMDFSVPRQCNYPKGHRGTCDWSPINPAGFYPLPENRSERRRRLLWEKRHHVAQRV